MTDRDVIVSFLEPSLRNIETKDVKVGIAEKPRGGDTRIYRVAYQKSTLSSYVQIVVDVSVRREAGGIQVSTLHTEQWNVRAFLVLLFLAGLFIPPLLGAYIVNHFVDKDRESHFPEWDRLQHRSEAIRDAVVACIEQVFRDLRIPEGMIKRSGKTH
jgi:hypothetical protein